MASKLNDIANKVKEQERLKKEELKRQKELAYKAKINSAKEWIANTYAKNQPEMKDFEEEAKNGWHSYTIFKTHYRNRWFDIGCGHTPFDTIGTASNKDLVPPYNQFDLEYADRVKLETDGCELVKKMFLEANKKNNWGFKIINTCQTTKSDESKSVTVVWS